MSAAPNMIRMMARVNDALFILTPFVCEVFVVIFFDFMKEAEAVQFGLDIVD
jgi:hypothetical protein